MIWGRVILDGYQLPPFVTSHGGGTDHLRPRTLTLLNRRRKRKIKGQVCGTSDTVVECLVRESTDTVREGSEVPTLVLQKSPTL